MKTGTVPEYSCTCTKCETVFTCDQSDRMIHGDVKCPLCGKTCSGSSLMCINSTKEPESPPHRPSPQQMDNSVSVGLIDQIYLAAVLAIVGTTTLFGILFYLLLSSN